MAEGTRPGGLTALAVLNFVFGGFGAIGALLLLGLFGLANVATDGEATGFMAEEMSEAGMDAGLLLLAMGLGVISNVLLIVSGVGYLQQKRVLGRNIGSLYGILALISTGLLVGVGKEFEFSSIIGLVYPVLTLIMVNTTFKEDLVN